MSDHVMSTLLHDLAGRPEPASTIDIAAARRTGKRRLWVRNGSISAAVAAVIALAVILPQTVFSTVPTSTASGRNTSTTSGRNSVTPADSGAANPGRVLTLEQSPTGNVADDMNPFSSTGAGSLLGFNDMIYEPLIQFNDLNPSNPSTPWLAKSYAWSNNGETITFTLQSGVKFTDGEAFNASMAAWEFNLLKKYPDINTQGLPIASATAPNATTLVVNFTTPQYTNLYNIGNTVMVPEGIWSKVGDPGKYADTSPVGTGPYTLDNFSPSDITLKANPGYWQGESHVPELNYPAYSSNTTANQALEDGSLQWAGNFVQNIQQDFLDKSSSNKVWDFGLQTETLIPNLNKAPFNGPDGLAVRQAISDGINREQISDVGEDGQQPPVQGAGSSTGLTLPLDKSYVTSSIAGDTVPPTGNASQAESVLKAAGYTMGSDGYFQKNGQDLAFTVEDPSPYTDFIQDDDLMQQELKAVGIKVTVDGTSVQQWTSDLADGNFDSMMHWGNGGISPYNMYDNWLDTSLYSKTQATGDNEDFQAADPTDAAAAEALLKNYAATPTTDMADQVKDVDGLGAIVAKDLPVIPLFYGVAWFEYNDSQWTGWPSPSNPYAPGEPTGPFNEVVVLHLKPVS